MLRYGVAVSAFLFLFGWGFGVVFPARGVCVAGLGYGFTLAVSGMAWGCFSFAGWVRGVGFGVLFLFWLRPCLSLFRLLRLVVFLFRAGRFLLPWGLAVPVSGSVLLWL